MDKNTENIDKNTDENTWDASCRSFADLMEVVKRLRAECPWDSVQTHQSLVSCLKNETDEVVEGISLLEKTGDASNLCEELGDLLMLIVLNSLIAQEDGLFTMEDVLEGVAAKMKFRHPKIFSPEDLDACGMSWEELKAREHERKKKPVC
jgi:tetrapyrrole methylase family protein/MazG family protein